MSTKLIILTSSLCIGLIGFGWGIYQSSNSSMGLTPSNDWVESPPEHCVVGKQKVRGHLGAARGISIARGRTKLALKQGRLNSTKGFHTQVKKSEIRQGWLYSLVCKVDS